MVIFTFKLNSVSGEGTSSFWDAIFYSSCSLEKMININAQSDMKFSENQIWNIIRQLTIVQHDIYPEILLILIGVDAYTLM